jgi:hypothetical protein
MKESSLIDYPFPFRFNKHREWFLEREQLVPRVLYTLVGIINDHPGKEKHTLRDKAVSLCVTILRSRVRPPSALIRKAGLKRFSFCF